ncbi:plasminogen-like [Tubulanus polymorphus]|uniref:plasminogen-like n=1 Tax=Tubulanus polymorphus TaxID=672921 RepID=UPI003DA3DB17
MIFRIRGSDVVSWAIVISFVVQIWVAGKPVEKFPFLTRSCRRDQEGRGYIGKANLTTTGRFCVRWDSIELTPYPKLRFIGENISEASNHCRNPDGEPKGPWCFYNYWSSVPWWGYCDTVPICKRDEATLRLESFLRPNDECKAGKLGNSYSGSINFVLVLNNYHRKTTVKHCIPWSVSARELNIQNFTMSFLREAGNKCRNPTNLIKPEGPWCFIGNSEWAYCDVPVCTNV